MRTKFAISLPNYTYFLKFSGDRIVDPFAWRKKEVEPKMKKRRKHARTKSRRSRSVYLGKRVKDTGAPGLDKVREVRGIANAIIEDYRAGRIPYRTAMSRMNLLSLIVKKDRKLAGHKLKSEEVVEHARRQLEQLAEKRRR